MVCVNSREILTRGARSRASNIAKSKAPQSIGQKGVDPLFQSVSESPKLTQKQIAIVIAVRSHRRVDGLDEVCLGFGRLVWRTVVMKYTFRVFDEAAAD